MGVQRAETPVGPPPASVRGVHIEEAQYGDFVHKAKTVDVTAQLSVYLNSLPLAGFVVQFWLLLRLERLIARHTLGGKHMYMSLPKASKNSLPGFNDPARGTDKKLKMVLNIDGEKVVRVIDEYEAFFIASSAVLPHHNNVLPVCAHSRSLLFQSLLWILKKRNGCRRLPIVRVLISLFINTELTLPVIVEEDELQLLYEGFREAAWPNTKMQPHNFVVLFPVFNNPLVLKSLFHSMDRDGNMSVDFAEYASALSIMTRGTLEQKIDCKYTPNSFSP